jgi:hypothetical protein
MFEKATQKKKVYQARLEYEARKYKEQIERRSAVN